MSRNQNPFDPPTLDSNPFDPSSAPSAQNPFTHANDSAFSLDSQDTERGLGGGASQTQAPPAASRGYGFGFGSGSSAAAPVGGASDLEERERRLREREAAVAAREAQVGVYANNWPPFFPFLHHDISTLPPQHQQVAKFLYAQWLALAVTLIINLLGCIFLLIAGSSEGGADVGGAGGYVLFIGIGSFILWYRPIYLGFNRTEGKAMAFFFYVYFIFAGFHLLYSIYMTIGIPSTGSAGLINTISMFSQGHILAGVFGILASLGWLIQSAGGGILYKRVWDYKNNNGDINFQAATNAMKATSIKTIILHQSRM